MTVHLRSALKTMLANLVRVMLCTLERCVQSGWALKSHLQPTHMLQVFPWASRIGPSSRLSAFLPRELGGVSGDLRGAPNVTDGMLQGGGSNTQCGRLKGKVLTGIDEALQVSVQWVM